eukprot:286605-Pyramimonas_sp.AAC.1
MLVASGVALVLVMHRACATATLPCAEWAGRWCSCVRPLAFQWVPSMARRLKDIKQCREVIDMQVTERR